jgi:hypothetical protein
MTRKWRRKPLKRLDSDSPLKPGRFAEKTAEERASTGRMSCHVIGRNVPKRLEEASHESNRHPISSH